MLAALLLLAAGQNPAMPNLIVQRSPLQSVFLSGVYFSDEGSYLVTSGDKGTVIWDARSGKSVVTIPPAHPDLAMAPVADIIDTTSMRQAAMTDKGVVLRDVFSNASVLLDDSKIVPPPGERPWVTPGVGFTTNPDEVSGFRWGKDHWQLWFWNATTGKRTRTEDIPFPEQARMTCSKDMRYAIGTETTFASPQDRLPQKVVLDSLDFKTHKYSQFTLPDPLYSTWGVSESDQVVLERFDQASVTVDTWKPGSIDPPKEIGTFARVSLSPNGRWLYGVEIPPQGTPLPWPARLIDLDGKTPDVRTTATYVPMALRNDGRVLVGGDLQQTGGYSIVDVASQTPLVEIGSRIALLTSVVTDPREEYVTVTFFRDLKRVLGMDPNSQANTFSWDLANGLQGPPMAFGYFGFCDLLAVSPEGSYYAGLTLRPGHASTQWEIGLYRYGSSQPIAEISADLGNTDANQQRFTRGLSALKFSGDGSRLFAVYSDLSVCVYESKTGKQLATLNLATTLGIKQIQTFDETSLAINRDGSVIGLPGNSDSDYCRLDGTRISLPLDFATANPNGSLLAIAGLKIRIYDFATMKPFRTMDAGGWPLAISPDDKLMVVERQEMPDPHAPAPTLIFEIRDFTDGKLVAKLPDGLTVYHSFQFTPDDRYVVHAESDDVVLFDAKSGKEVARLFVDEDGDALAITPDGYYSGNRGAADMVGIRLGNHGAGVEQFDLALNRPEKVAAAIGYASPDELRWLEWLSKKRLERSTVQGTVDYRSLPEVRIDTSKVPEEVAGDSVSFSVAASSQASELSKLKIVDNGEPIAFGSDAGPAPLTGCPLSGKQSERRVDVQLTPGVNKIEASVVDTKGVESLRETFVVVSKLPARTPDLYIAAGGVSKYKNASADLGYAASDATAMASIFSSAKLGYGQVHTKVLVDQQVTRESIGSLRSFLAQAKPDDRVILFLAGHGIASGNDYFYGTWDIDFAKPKERGASYAEIEGQLSDIPCRNKILLLDTCHAGEIDRDVVTFDPNKDSPLPPDVKARSVRLTPGGEPPPSSVSMSDYLGAMFASFSNDSGVVAIGASSGSEYAFESPEFKSGVFTYAVRQALTPGSAGYLSADANLDGVVSIRELQTFVGAMVTGYTNGRQRPTLRQDNFGFDFPIAWKKP